MSKRRALALGIVGVLCMGMIAGCSGGNAGGDTDKEEQEEETQEEAQKEETTEEVKTIGSIYEVTLENKTGKDITGISVKDSSMEAYPANMLSEGDKFAKDEKRRLVYNATSAQTAAAEQQTDGGDAPVLDPQYDIQLTFDDGTTLVLSAFPFEDMEAGEICLEDEVAFVKYESIETAEQMSTKEAELAIKAEAEAAAQAEAEAAAAAQAEAEAAAAAQAQAEAEAAAAQQAASSQQYYDNSSNSGGSGSSSGSGNQDGCVNDGLFY